MINVTSPVNQLGFGLCGLNILLELEKAGMEPAFWPIGPVEAPPEHIPALQTMRNRTNSFDRYRTSLRIWHPFDLAHHVGEERVAFTMFELNKLKPYEINHLKNQDQVIVPSKWAKRILVENGILPGDIFVAPLGVDHSVFFPAEPLRGSNSTSSAEPLQGSNTTNFLNVGKWEVRKGHDFLIEAFCAAFEPTDNVQLGMLCENQCLPTQSEYERYNREWIQTYKNSKMGNKITILPRLKSQSDVANIMRQADCGVFPARGEGWNLELAEMLAMGKHCIATYYSAHTEFINNHNCLLVEGDELEDAHDGVWFDASSPEWNGEAGQWMKLGRSQLEQVVFHMREIHQQKQSGTLSVNQWGVDTLRNYTWANTVNCIIEGLGIDGNILRV